MSSARQSTTQKSLQPYRIVAEAIARLFHPLAEVVIHDVPQDRIFAIYNCFSRRQIGDPSYLERVDFDITQTIIGPYEKINFDGRRLKSISIVIRDDRQKPVVLLCVNTDLSAFDSMHKMLGTFMQNYEDLKPEQEKLFKDDTYEKINQFVQNYARTHQVVLDALTRERRQDLMIKLREAGAFREKHAADYIARIVGVSRATIYNDLNQRKGV